MTAFIDLFIVHHMFVFYYKVHYFCNFVTAAAAVLRLDLIVIIVIVKI